MLVSPAPSIVRFFGSHESGLNNLAIPVELLELCHEAGSYGQLALLATELSENCLREVGNKSTSGSQSGRP